MNDRQNASSAALHSLSTTTDVYRTHANSKSNVKRPHTYGGSVCACVSVDRTGDVITLTMGARLTYIRTYMHIYMALAWHASRSKGVAEWLWLHPAHPERIGTALFGPATTVDRTLCVAARVACLRRRSECMMHDAERKEQG